MLSVNLSQFKSKVLVTKVFVESLNAIFNPQTFSWCDGVIDSDSNALKVCTKTKLYGYIKLTVSGSITNEELQLLQNAVQMLALLLEKLEQEQLLKNQKEHLDHLVHIRTAELANEKEALMEARNRLQIVSDNMLDLVSLTDLEGNYKFAGTSHQILGYDNEFFLGKNVMDFVHPDDLPDVQEGFVDFLTNKKPKAEARYRYRTANGSYLWFETFGTFIYDETGEPKEILFNTRDITERKRAEEALSKSEAIKNTMVSSIGDVIVIIDQNAINQYKSPNITKLFGWKPEELVGKSTWENVHPNDLEAAKLFLDTIASKPNSSGTLELQYMRKDGKYVWIEITLINLIHDKDIQGILGNYHEITERKKAELEIIKAKESIEEREKRFRNMFEFHSATMLLIEPETGKVIDANKSAIEFYGYDMLTLRSMFIHEINQLNPEQVAKERLKALKNNCNYFVFPHKLSNGNVRTVEVHSTPINYEGNQILFSIIHDITERDKAEKDLIEARNLLLRNEELYRITFEEAAVGIAHVDIKGNLTKGNNKFCTITGYAQKELLEMNISQLTHPDDLLIEHGYINQVLTHKISTYSIEKRYIRKDGNTIWVTLNSNVVLDKYNQIRFAIATISDITEQKLLQDEIIKSKELAEENEKLYRLLSENISDGIVLIENNCIQYVSPGYSRLLGRSSEYLKSMKIEDIFSFLHPDDRERIINDLAYVHKNQIERHSYSYRVITSSGEYLWVEDSLNSDYDETGDRIRTIIRVRDISKLKKAEVELTNSLTRFSALVQHLQSGVFYINTDGEILEVNDALLKILGSPDKEKTKKINVFKFQPLIDIGYTDKLRECIETRKIVTGETEYTSKWGKNAIVNYYFVPIVENDIVVGVLANNEDVTEYRKAEQALKESEQRLKLACQSAELGIWDWNVKENVMIWDERMYELYGLEKDSSNKTIDIWSNRIHPEDKDRALFECEEALKGNLDFNTSFKVLHPDGIELYIKADGLVIRNFKGEAIRMIGVNRDITEIKQNEIELIKSKEKAEESDRLKTSFLQNMSHEIRTPLNSIIGFSERITSPMITDEKRKFYSDIIVKSGFQLLSIVTDILTISSIDTGQEKLNEEKVCINTIVSETEEVFKRQVIGKNVKLVATKTQPDDMVDVLTDNTKLIQILNNLLANAVKFTSEGEIEFGYNLKDDELEFFVKDSGIGIHRSKYEVIFDRFTQAEENIPFDYGGTGLGLSICKGFVELMGGSIWVESEFGKGSTFYFTIPFNPTVKPNKNIDDGTKHTNWKSRKLTILIAEDEFLNFLYLEELLKSYGFDVVHAANGKTAVEQCQNIAFDLVLMDMKMPVLDGVSAARIIKKQNPNLPIVAQTAYALAESEKHNDLFDDIVVKPITIKYIEKMLSRIFA